MQFEVKG